MAQGRPHVRRKRKCDAWEIETMNRVLSAGKVAAVGGSVRALDEDLLSAEELDMDIVLGELIHCPVWI